MKSDNFISKRKILLVSVGILAVLLAALILAFALRPGRADPTDPTTSGPPGTEDTGQSTDPPEETDPTKSTWTEPTVKREEDITCEKIARFSGPFVEDGKDTPIENVAAILVTNQTDRFLDLATITYDVDGQEATFIVMGLPAGKSAWVMESTGMTISEDATFTYVDCIKAFRDDVITSSEDVTIQHNGTMLRATNNTDRTLENVFVYYKVVHKDGNYFGGIAYAARFGTLEPGETAEKIAGHYEEGSTEIVRIGWQESQTDEAS